MMTHRISMHQVGTSSQRARYLMSAFARLGNIALFLALLATAIVAAVLGRI
jgi:hypothetical protein